MKFEEKQKIFFNNNKKEHIHWYHLAMVFTFISGILLIIFFLFVLPTLMKPLLIPLFALLLFTTGVIRIIRFLNFFNSPWLYH